MQQKEFLTKMKECVIVYAEDDKDIKEIISEYLRRYTPHVFVASNGEDAYEIYKQVKPNLMLLDINLPKLSGIELAKMIRKDDKQTRIIMATAYTNKEFLLDAIELKLTKYLVKPITVDEMSEAFKKCILEVDDFSEKFNSVDLGNDYSYCKKAKILSLNGQNIYLRKKELLLLDYMIENKNRVLSYNQLEQVLCDGEICSENALRAQIKNLRKNLYRGIIKNISGIGYEFIPISVK